MEDITIYGHVDTALSETVQLLRKQNIGVRILDERQLNVINVNKATEIQRLKAANKGKEKEIHNAGPSGGVLSKAKLAQRKRREREKLEKYCQSTGLLDREIRQSVVGAVEQNIGAKEIQRLQAASRGKENESNSAAPSVGVLSKGKLAQRNRREREQLVIGQSTRLFDRQVRQCVRSSSLNVVGPFVQNDPQTSPPTINFLRDVQPSIVPSFTNQISTSQRGESSHMPNIIASSLNVMATVEGNDLQTSPPIINLLRDVQPFSVSSFTNQMTTYHRGESSHMPNIFTSSTSLMVDLQQGRYERGTLRRSAQRKRRCREASANTANLLNRPPMHSRAHVLPERHFLGLMNVMCRFCSALHWNDEKLSISTRNNILFGKCCLQGKVRLPLLLTPLPPLQDLYDGVGPQSTSFRNHIRQYNAANAFTSLGVRIDQRVLPGIGPTSFTIHGELRHRTGSLLPQPGEAPVYAQLYIYDPAEALNRFV